MKEVLTIRALGGGDNLYILTDVKSTLAIVEGDTTFDAEILLYINTVMGKLSQLGFAYADTTPIIYDTTAWGDLVGYDTTWEMVRVYIGLSVRVMFDPPTSSIVLGALNNQIAELEWRIVNNLNIRGKGGEDIV